MQNAFFCCFNIQTKACNCKVIFQTIHRFVANTDTLSKDIVAKKNKFFFKFKVYSIL